MSDKANSAKPYISPLFDLEKAAAGDPYPFNAAERGLVDPDRKVLIGFRSGDSRARVEGRTS